ncbi:hypothetical protein G7046_g9963 [Stylonectria norvegica]|nr:hypothetical protein G7046_g9963 [Stylonectria norvegica]
MAFRLPAQNRPAFQPQCTHLTMTRLYGSQFVCDSCRRPGPFGWVYRCTQDRDELIEQAASRGYTTAFDELGQVMTEELRIRKGSPAAREDKFSFLTEITPEQMANYRPDQLATILRQREDLQTAIHREKLKKNSAILLSRYRQSAVSGSESQSQSSDYTSPWVCADHEECQYKVCSFCRPGSADRAALSMNAVANGDISPTAATGFGFHILGERPVVDANVVRNIGLRTAPPLRCQQSFEDSSLASDLDMMELLDDQIARSCGNWHGGQAEAQFDHEAMMPLLADAPGQLTHSRRCDNLAAFDEPNEFISQGASIRPPWTPPPSPSRYGQESMTKRHVLGLAAEPSITNGRSSTSLKTNPSMRNQVLCSVPSSSALAHVQQSCHSCTETHHIPYLPESAYDVGLTLPFDADAYEIARTTPLGPPDSMEETYLHGIVTPMMEYEEEERFFTPAPLKVDHGVAVLEESMELGVPDVITQY